MSEAKDSIDALTEAISKVSLESVKKNNSIDKASDLLTSLENEVSTKHTTDSKKQITFEDRCNWCKDGKLIGLPTTMQYTSNKERLKKSNIIEKAWGVSANAGGTSIQWTTNLSEYLLKEVLEKHGHVVTRPRKIDGYKPDWETETNIWEVKCRNWTTPGTIGEKVLGNPYKYAEVPGLYKKPLKIVLMAYQEYEYSNDSKVVLFGDNISPNRKKILDLYESIGITYIKFTDLLKNL